MTFRLERIKATERERKSTWITDLRLRPNQSNSAPIVLELTPSSASSYDGNWFSIVIGKNGVGKSRILASIAEAFSVREGEFIRSRNDSMDLEITYFTDGERHQFSSDHEDKHHNRSQELLTPPGPSKVICCTMTPFDKFRLSRDVIRDRFPSMNDESESVSKDLFYCYTGFRDSNGRTNFRSSIFRSIKGIFLRKDYSLDRLHKLQEVFRFLGYKPQIDLHFGLSTQSRSQELISAIRSKTPFDEFPDRPSYGSRPAPIDYFLSKEPNGSEKLQVALHRIEGYLDRTRSGSIRISLNADEEDRSLLASAFLLRDVRLLSFRDVMLSRSNNGSLINILDASSGEISIVAGMLGVASNIEDNALILIDEPEISLHPEWQEQYMDLLKSTFSPFSGCHFVVATHSPILLSDIGSEGSHVVSLSDQKIAKLDELRLSGASVDEVLVTAFGVAGNGNLYIKQETIKALNLLARGSDVSASLSAKLQFLMRSRKIVDDDTELAKLIDDLLTAASDLGRL